MTKKNQIHEVRGDRPLAIKIKRIIVPFATQSKALHRSVYLALVLREYESFMRWPSEAQPNVFTPAPCPPLVGKLSLNSGLGAG